MTNVISKIHGTVSVLEALFQHPSHSDPHHLYLEITEAKQSTKQAMVTVGDYAFMLWQLYFHVWNPTSTH